MKERPIIMSGESVRAILAGTKTQTRRVILPPFERLWGHGIATGGSGLRTDTYHVHVRSWEQADDRYTYCRFGGPGDRLWVRETWACGSGVSPRVEYAADGPLSQRRRSPIHMPRWASRITLEVTDVRVQRLQEISEDDAKAEGVDGYVGGEGTVSRGALNVEPGYWHPHFFRQGFSEAWDALNGKRFPWSSNPWVFVVDFRRLLG